MQLIEDSNAHSADRSKKIPTGRWVKRLIKVEAGQRQERFLQSSITISFRRV
jgi:hypothetical protein